IVDKSRLYAVTDNFYISGTGDKRALRELNRLVGTATFLEPAQVPADVVTMNSKVRIQIQGSESRIITPVFPEDADPLEGRVSILAPMCLALLGARVGDTVSWEAPDGAHTAQI